MHRDVVALVNGGYTAQEIIDAFVGVYGERVRMAPKKSGFNAAGVGHAWRRDDRRRRGTVDVAATA